MPIGDLIPPAFFFPEKKDEVIIMIKRLDIPPRRKKQTLVEWGKIAVCALTYDDYVDLLGPVVAKMLLGG